MTSVNPCNNCKMGSNEKNVNISVISSGASSHTIDLPVNSRENLVPVRSRSSFLKRVKSINKKVTVLFFIIIILSVALLVISIAFASWTQKEEICESYECIRSAANLAMSMDRSAEPCKDFYKFTCGKWRDEHPKPDSTAGYDWFLDRQDKVIRQIREFLQKNNSINDPLPVMQSRDMYTACLDTEKMDELGYEPIYTFLDKVGLPRIPTYFNITDSNEKFNWLKTISEIKKISGKDVLVGFSIYWEPRNRTVNRLCLGTPSVSSPLASNKDMEKRLRKMIMDPFYMSEGKDEEHEMIRTAAYTAYVKAVMKSLISNMTTDLSDNFDSDLLSAAKKVVKISKEIYKLAHNDNETTNVYELDSTINMTVYELQNYTNQHLISNKLKTQDIWKPYIVHLFRDIKNVTLNFNKTDKILIEKNELDYLALIAEYVANSSQIELELYIWWSTIEMMISHTTSEMRNLHRRLSQAIFSIEAQEARSIYCANQINNFMGMAVSYSIANQSFINNTKPKVKQMLNDIRDGFHELIKSVDWMDGETKAATIDKCNNMRTFIGFPDWLFEKDEIESYYEGMSVSPDRYLDNLLDILKLEMEYILSSLRVKNTVGWATDPTDVNAFHTFQSNAITIPLAILQYPFYNLGLEALNYGAIGSILGHELTHGFDDTGRLYDKEGNLRSWWTNKTVNEYVNRTDCFISQYGSYYIPELKKYIDGENTLGENIADNGGIHEAVRAYQIFRKRNGKELLLPGFEEYTHDQLLFIAYGNLWCETQTKTSLRWSLEDVHCPGKIRLHGTLENSPEFASAFNCPKGSPMNPVRGRCRLW